MTSSLIPSDKAIPVKRLAEFRENLGLTKDAMAAFLCMSRQWYLYMENGRILPSPFKMRYLQDRSLTFLTPNDFFPFLFKGEYRTPSNNRVVQGVCIDYPKHKPCWLKHFWHWRKNLDPKRTYQQVADLLGANSHQMIQAWEKGVSLPRTHAMFLKIYSASEGKVTPDAMILNEAFDIPPVDWCSEIKEHFFSRVGERDEESF